MALFIALYKWRPEEEIVMVKELVAGFTAIVEGRGPKGVELCATYSTTAQRAFCVWKAPSKEALEKTFDQFAPTLKKATEFVPVAQSYAQPWSTPSASGRLGSRWSRSRL